MADPETGIADPECIPDWVPDAAREYITHTEAGLSMRQLARGAGCHPSTIMRRMRQIEARRDDPLVDEALEALRGIARNAGLHQLGSSEENRTMNAQSHQPKASESPDTETLDREGRRILRRLNEPGACLAVARDMEKAVVVREGADGHSTRTAVVDRAIARAMALKDWIACARPGRISRYRITAAGRAALKRLLAEQEAERGFAEAPMPFADQHGDREEAARIEARRRKARFNLGESPIGILARRRDRDGKPFLSREQIAAAERLREDFELAQMDPRVAQNWERFLAPTERGSARPEPGGTGSSAARDRVNAALADLGPGLGDVAIRVCCFLEGLETAEKRMGWSARSGKIVLRIALERLARHYRESGGGDMIG